MDRNRGAVQRGRLPIDDAKDSIVATVKDNLFVVIIGETGSGKTTQLPQMLLDNGVSGGSVVVTQPRRVAAITCARRVASERGVRIGAEVGYTIRFEDVSSAGTTIKFVTDGTLVRECLSDPTLAKYGTVMLDEAHERSLHTDILLGLVKRAVQDRKATKRPLRLVITSATLDAEVFCAYFDNCPVLSIPGRVFPVDLYHSASSVVMTAEGPSTRAYIQDSVDLALKIHRSQPKGHILVFLTGQDEIDRACARLHEMLPIQASEEEHGQSSMPVVRSKEEGGGSKESGDEDDEDEAAVPQHLQIIPLYGLLSAEDQAKAFADVPDGRTTRKCIVATNIAETSVTVPGVRYVIDAGFVKQKTWDPKRGMESLVVIPTSKVAAHQRAGRAGRTNHGQCFRLYSKESFDAMMEEAVPEIKRCNLSSTVLQLKSMGIMDVLGFDFFESPGFEGLEEALLALFALGALDAAGRITEMGEIMSKLPLDPNLSRMLLAAVDEGCLSEACVIAAMISVESVWFRPNRRRQQQMGGGSEELEEAVRAAHEQFAHPKGDHLTLLNVWQSWEKARFDPTWARDRFLNLRPLRMAKLTHTQLRQEMGKLKGVTFSPSPSSSSSLSSSTAEKGDTAAVVEQAIVRAFVRGYSSNTGKRCSDGVYQVLPRGGGSKGLAGATRGPLAYLEPSSSVRKAGSPPFVVYHELALTSRPLLRTVLGVDGGALCSFLMECRSPLDSPVTAAALSGQKPPAPLTPPELSHRGSGAASTSSAAISTKPQRSDEDRGASVDSARERYLQRKRARETK